GIFEILPLGYPNFSLFLSADASSLCVAGASDSRDDSWLDRLGPAPAKHRDGDFSCTPKHQRALL
ncbi:hypothetical protein AVDCRST_MAG81-4353, partial [uncultured Synechococcales cyanobacterium]